MATLASRTPNAERRSSSIPTTAAESAMFFILTVLGFSFWFLMAVPFASHRETYSWLAGAHTETFLQQFSFGLSSTYRPLAQVITWLGFWFLNPSVFPTSAVRQALLQGFVWTMFLLAWWYIYRSATQKRIFALVACLTGAVFFSGYIQLFHIYGMFYVPVILTLGFLLHLHASGRLQHRQIWFAVVATILAFWHPFATALFLGCYFGFYVETYKTRGVAQRLRGLAILVPGIVAIALFVVLFPRAQMPVGTKLLGFLVTYQTNEVNRFASLLAFLLALTVVFSMRLSTKLRLLALFVVAALSIAFLLSGLPILLVWIGAALVKLIGLRRWTLFFLMLTASLLPFGGAIGSPMYALYAIILAAYVTAFDWSEAEAALSFIEPGYVAGAIAAALIVLLLVRAGVRVPVVTKAATPLLAERERTYQLENILAWLHKSGYCNTEVDFVTDADSPVNDVKSALSRQNRPPSALHDVRFFWDSVFRCRNGQSVDRQGQAALITFGESSLAGSAPVYTVPGRYAGNATVWLPNRSVPARLGSNSASSTVLPTQ